MTEQENEKLSMREKLKIFKTYFVGKTNDIKALGDHNPKNDFYGDVGEIYHLIGIGASQIGFLASIVTLNPVPAAISIAYLADAYSRGIKWDFCCDGENHYHGPGLVGTIRDKLSAPSDLEKAVQ